MNGTIAGIFATIVIVGVLLWVLRDKIPFLKDRFAKGSSKNPLLGKINWRKVPVGWVARTTDVKQTTPAGIAVYSLKGVDNAKLQDIDRALEAEKARAIQESGNTYTKFPAPQEIEVYITPAPILSPENKVPSLLVRANREWEAGQYDQHWQVKYDTPQPDKYQPELLHYSEPDDCAVVCCAENVWGLSTQGSIPPLLRFDINPDIMYEGCCNALSHGIIALNDSEWFSINNGPDHQHPIPYRPVPQANVAAGFAGSVHPVNQARLGRNQSVMTPVK